MLTFDDKFEIVDDLVKIINDEELSILSKFLKARIARPDSFVTFLGETSSGKSSIINGLLNKNVLCANAAPSTGSITEIYFNDECEHTQYYVVNSDATMEKINCEIFNSLEQKPDDHMERLRVVEKTPVFKFDNMRLFDTPGYGSILENHENVLTNFIPNSDVIVYTVAYRVGIQDNDFAFMRYLFELINRDIEFILVINRCPMGITENNRRIVEIIKYCEDLLHRKIEYFLIENITYEDTYPLPYNKKLWEAVERIVNSDKRKKAIDETFSQFVQELFDKCERKVQNMYLNVNLNEVAKKEIMQVIDELNNKKPYVNAMINERFKIIAGKIKGLLALSKTHIFNNIDNYLEARGALTMDETIAYVLNHLLPFQSKENTLEVTRYIEIELEKLSKEVDDYLSKEIAKFQKDIKIIITTHLEQAGKGIVKEFGGRFASFGLVKYFAQYGGRGGAGAGVANAASHFLKVIGDFFGKTFSRETHNALKHILSKIGATSTKAISVSVAAIIETVTIVYDYNTWKPNLKKKVTSGLDSWVEETNKFILSDLEELRKANIETIGEIIDSQVGFYEWEVDDSQESEVLKLLDAVKLAKEKIGV